MQLDDEVIVSRCLAGDQAAFAFLVNKYKEAVHAYAYHKVLDYQEAQDITQEVFIKAYEKLAQLKWPHRFQSWLHTIVSNECKMWFRRNSKDRRQEMPLEDVPVGNLNELAVRAHGDEDIKLTVRSAMETLPTDSQLALSLYYMSDLSTKEVAGFMGISPNNVGVKLHRARKQLGERLEKMLGKQLKTEKLRSGLTFKMMDAIRNMPIPSLPKPRPIKWAPLSVSIGVALLIGVIGFGISTGDGVSQDISDFKSLELLEVSLLPNLDEQGILDMADSGENELVAANSWNDPAEAGKASGTEIVVNEVWNAMWMPRGNFVGLSPDGQYVSFANRGNGNLMIRDLSAGKNRDITSDAIMDKSVGWDKQQSAIDSTWSPDGKQIAYSWRNGRSMELRIAGLDNSKPRVLFRSEQQWRNCCYDWSEDGKHILAWIRMRTKSKQAMGKIALISVADGSVKVLKKHKIYSFHSIRMSLSPDGRYVAYDFPVEEHEGLRDIYLLATDGSGEEIRLTEHPADDYYPVWSPDGKTIAFVSNRSKDRTAGLWLQMVNSKPMQKPQLVKKETGSIFSQGFTRNGSLFYITSGSSTDVCVAALDMEKEKLLSPPRPIWSKGKNTAPVWSPDGKSMAYASQRIPPGSFRQRTVLVVRSAETGKEREFALKSNTFSSDPNGPLGQILWSPDGKSILYGGSPSRNLHLIDIQTGKVTTNIATNSTGDIKGVAWSPDGKRIFFTRGRYQKENKPASIVALDLETRTEREVYSSHGDWKNDIANDGSLLAVAPGGWRIAFRDRSGLKVVTAMGEKVHPVLDLGDLYTGDNWKKEVDMFAGPLGWTTDGKHILFAKNPKELWQISAEGGKPKKILEMEKGYISTLSPVSIHPDGQRVAFARQKITPKGLWSMGNFLPVFMAAR